MEFVEEILVNKLSYSKEELTNNELGKIILGLIKGTDRNRDKIEKTTIPL